MRMVIYVQTHLKSQNLHAFVLKLAKNTIRRDKTVVGLAINDHKMQFLTKFATQFRKFLSLFF